MWTIGAVLGLAVLSTGCSSETSQLAVGGTGGTAGSGAANGGDSAHGGTGPSGGQTTITEPACPDEEPEAGSPCASAATNCPYDVCGDDTSSMFSCRGGSWQLTRACGLLDCPAERPPFLSDCAPLEGLQCTYVEDCCGTDPATQTVFMRCESSQWTVLGTPEETCSFCRVHHEDGTACEQPSECKSVGCYWTSCYAEPLVEECVEGLWRSRTLCSK